MSKFSKLKDPRSVSTSFKDTAPMWGGLVSERGGGDP